jgi:hypothetical protein
MQLANNATTVLDGEYSYIVTATTGTAKLQVETGNNDWTDIPDTSTTNADLLKTLKFSGHVKAVITGDAIVNLNLITR